MNQDNADKSENQDGWSHTHSDRKIYPTLKDRARIMRKNPTPAEALLWGKLRNKRLNGLKFRRQHPIGQFIVDFYCAEARLVVEVDGSSHDEPEQADYDAARSEYLAEQGLRVLRVTNAQVIQQMDGVLERIGGYLSG